MIAALAYERIRISTVRSTWIAFALALLLPFGLAWLIVSSSGGATDPSGAPVEGSIEWAGALGFPLSLTAVVASVVAAQAIGQEHRFGIIRLTLTAFPRRGVALAAKVAVVVVACVLLALMSYAGSWLALAANGYPTPPDGASSPDASDLLRGIVFVVLWGLSAFALAGITRQTAIGIAIPIVSGLIVENILQFVLLDRAEWLAKILPWSTASRWAEDPYPDEVLAVGWGALGIFAVWVALFLVAQVTLFLRRDA